MSADNGIYTLKTPLHSGDKDNFEYRVVHAQAIENITYNNPNGNSVEIVKYFGEAEVFTDQNEASDFAVELSKEFSILEYGISTIELIYPFQFYLNNAKYEVIEQILKFKNQLEKELGHCYSGTQGSLLFSCDNLEALWEKGIV